MMENTKYKESKNKQERDFLSSPVVRTSPSNAGGTGSISSQRTKIPHALQPKYIYITLYFKQG